MENYNKYYIKKPIIRDMYHYVYTMKCNCVMGITGRVGLGKSWTAVKLGDMFDIKFSMEKNLVYNVNSLLRASLETIKVGGKPLTIKRIHEIDNVIEWLEKNESRIRIRPGRVIIFDEAGSGAYIREFWSMDNKILGKILQIWRFLRLVVIFVVPEKMRMADSTISRFMNIEIRIFKKKKDFVQATAWNYIGWNEYRNEPYRQRVTGCRGTGWLNIYPMSADLANEYESVSKRHKILTMVELVKEYRQTEAAQIGKSRSMTDDVDYVKNNFDKFTDKDGMLDKYLIKAHFGIGLQKAYTIRHVVDKYMQT